jgi:hypothetical protein
MVWPQLAAEVKLLDRLFEPFQLMKDRPAAIYSIPTARAELQRMLVSHQGIGWAPKLRERSAELYPQLDIVGLELDRLVKGLQRLLLPSLPLQRGSKARQIMRLGNAAWGFIGSRGRSIPPRDCIV